MYNQKESMMGKEVKRMSIATEVLQATLNYISAQPYNQVANLLNEIQKDAKPIEEVKNNKEKSNE